MAIYHFHIKVHSRRRYNGPRASANAHALAAYRSGSVQTSSILRSAAYRSGGVLKDTSTGQVHDFRRKRGVEWTGIMAPSHAPDWVYDRQKLWEAVEASETRINSRFAREAEVTLPRELTLEQNKALIRAFVQKEFVDRGVIADIAIHKVKAADGLEQPHAHILLTTRDIGRNGFGKKRRDWNAVDLLRQWRAAWQDACNAALADAGSDSRIDHRTLEAQGKPFLPSVTMGKAQHANDNYDFVKKKKMQAEETTAYNADLVLNLFPLILSTVAGYLEGGPVGAIEAGIAGLLPGAGNVLGSIPRAVVNALHDRA